MVGVLVLEVGEVGRHDLQPPGEEPRQLEGQPAFAVEHRWRVVDDRDRRWLAGDDVGRRGDAEEQRHLADARAPFGDGGDRDPALLDRGGCRR